jgi:hypothetical protein
MYPYCRTITGACHGDTRGIIDGDNGLGNAAQYTSVKLNSSGFAVISYYATLTQDLNLAVCNNATCTTKTLTTVDSTGDVEAMTSVTLNSSGFPVISYLDFSNRDLQAILKLQNSIIA